MGEELVESVALWRPEKVGVEDPDVLTTELFLRPAQRESSEPPYLFSREFSFHE